MRILAAIFICSRVVAADLSWSPVTNAVGYSVYWGAAAKAYTNRFSATSGSVLLFLPKGIYHFAVASVSSNGIESNFSRDVSFDSREWVLVVTASNVSYVAASLSALRVATSSVVRLTNPVGPQFFIGTNVSITKTNYLK